MMEKLIQTHLKITETKDGDLQIPLIDNDIIHTWDYVIVNVNVNRDSKITVRKYDNAQPYLPNTMLGKHHFISFVNFNKDYLKKHSRNKKILSRHQH